MEAQEDYMDIEKMSSIDISQDNVKSITDKCHQLQELQQQYKDIEEQLSKTKNKVRRKGDDKTRRRKIGGG